MGAIICPHLFVLDKIQKCVYTKDTALITGVGAQMSNTRITNTEQQNILFDAIRKGAFRYVAANMAGISESTFNTWRKRGVADLENPDTSDTEYAKWWAKILACEAEFENRVVTDWLGHTSTDWRAARDYLRVRFPDRYNPTTQNSDNNAMEVIVARDED